MRSCADAGPAVEAGAGARSPGAFPSSGVDLCDGSGAGALATVLAGGTGGPPGAGLGAGICAAVGPGGPTNPLEPAPLEADE